MPSLCKRIGYLFKYGENLHVHLESRDEVGRGGPECWRPPLLHRGSDQQLPNHPRGLLPCPRGTMDQTENSRRPNSQDLSKFPQEMQERVRQPKGRWRPIMIALSAGSGAVNQLLDLINTQKEVMERLQHTVQPAAAELLPSKES
ncbi:UNVERIFIED_CONTAM: hypothetical protein K2H54_067124 [Gekko kuhli]